MSALCAIEARDGPDLTAARVEQTALALAEAVDSKAAYRPSHCQAVARVARLICFQLGIDRAHANRIRVAALLHDVGKLRVPDTILLKPQQLTESEWDVIRDHPHHGHDFLRDLGLRIEARWVLHHHERMDGQGYPSGLDGAGIPLESRIIGVADAFDTLVSCRVYQPAHDRGDALRELHANAGDQFDPLIVDALTTVVAASPLPPT